MTDNEQAQPSRFFLRVDASNIVVGYATGMVDFLGMTEVSSDIFAQALPEIGSCKYDGTSLSPYTPPAPPPVVPTIISSRQFWQAAAIHGDITQDEALAAVTTGTMPSEMAVIVAKLPADQQFAAKMTIMGAKDFDRTTPLVATVAALMGWDDTKVQALWTLGGSL